MDTLWPVAGSQILTVLSLDADASRLPSCDQAIVRTQALWPLRVDTLWPVAGSQILTISSQDADASRLPLCDQTINLTSSGWPSTAGVL
ncbi:hypothetical protein N7467_003127 [Penicillium canescens]|nr:hypothetical protein N7467_003127 [Penicillium canescens]